MASRYAVDKNGQQGNHQEMVALSQADVDSDEEDTKEVIDTLNEQTNDDQVSSIQSHANMNSRQDESKCNLERRAIWLLLIVNLLLCTGIIFYLVIHTQHIQWNGNQTSTFAFSTNHSDYVGDYKISILDKSHGNWLLCDGSFLDSRDHTELFNVIGYTFGETSGGRFALPNSKNRVIGMNGDKYHTGDVVGSDTMTLSIDHIPPHSHRIIHTEYGTSYDKPIYRNSGVGHQVLNYDADRHVIDPQDTLNTSRVGSGTSFSVHQPTIFVGNMFIYAGNK